MRANSADDHLDEVWRAHRAYLVDLAFRMLGDIGAAEDVVQDAFARLLQARPGEIADERGWLIVVTSRLCLDRIKSARARRERPEDMGDLDRRTASGTIDPADRVTLDDSVRLALIVVLERLTPAERVVFVLHDVFQLPFDVIAETVGRTSASCRQLARRARQKVEAADIAQPQHIESARHRRVAEAFIAACANGDLGQLLSVLDPDVSGTIDIRAHLVVTGAPDVGANILRYWGQPATTLVTLSVGIDDVLLAFTDRELAGVLLLRVVDERVRKIHVLVDPVKISFLKSQLSLLSS